MSHTDPRVSAGHESDDINIKALVSFTLALFVVGAVIHVMLWGLLAFFQRQATKNDPPQSPLARPAVQMPRNTIGEPVFGRGEGVQLLTSEPAVLGKNRESETEALTTYGWTDEKSGAARIPIAEAKKLIVERGLPARSEGVDAELGTHRAAYGESTGGRNISTAVTHETAKPDDAKQEAAPAAHDKGHQ
jgi:hypothetical protein